MSAQDMRDVLGIAPDAARPPPAKKRKLLEKRPLEKGMAREVSALMGERAPPVSMIQVQPKYKQRPKRHLKVTPWELASFKNDARTDDLVLHHWQKRQQTKVEPVSESTTEGATDPAAPEDTKPEPTQKPYQFAKYNIQVDVPVYTDEMYNASLKSEDWSKEETDYLVELVRDYGQKWAIVWDRFEFTPSEGEAKTRSMEDLKVRYYNVRAAVLAHETPVASMNGQQYALYQLLTHFDSKQETSRKRMTEAHLYRSEIEVQEETALLAELQRIMMNHTSLENVRKDLRDRLDYPSSGSNSMQYTTSQALHGLFQQLLAADRSKKDRRLKELPNAASNLPSAASHRDSISAAAGHNNKRPRDSMASVGSAASEMPETRSRALSPHSKDRFFVSTHDKLSSGVSFASDKLTKPRVAKSSVQTERIAAVLAQLRIPDAIPLPTAKVVEAFERLMGRVHGLLDMRKLAEKEEAELKVREAERGMVRSVAEEEGARGQKRSASVLSEGEGREKRSKSRHAA